MSLDLKLILDLHAKWLRGDSDGKRANLREADLRGASLREADLSGANLREADLSGANLRGANLRGASLRGASLRGANLRGASLREADPSGANLDFSAWPLCCGSFGVKADMRLVAQLAKHLAMLDVSQCCGGIKEAMEHFRRTGLAHLFDEFRDDLPKTPVKEGKDVA